MAVGWDEGGDLNVGDGGLGLHLALEGLDRVALRLDDVVEGLEGRADHVLDVAPLVHALQEIVHHQASGVLAKVHGGYVARRGDPC
jgi:hypothetical protein